MLNGKRPILLAEDDEQHAYLIRKLLTRAGVDIPLVTVEDGASAIAYLKGEDPYADRDAHPLPGGVLLDLQLPVRSGLEVLAWLRERPEFATLPVAVLTASRDEEHVNRAFELGATFFLVKPAAFEALLELMVGFGDVWFEPTDGAASAGAAPDGIASDGVPSDGAVSGGVGVTRDAGHGDAIWE